MSDVAIIMGSDSDWPTMEEAAKVLDGLGISYTADVVSAHRMPLEMVEFSQTAQAKGYKVIIAGAGGAAHLPGMVASLTTLPVIGIPVALKNLDGMDSLLSRSNASRSSCCNCRCGQCKERGVISSSHSWSS